MRVDGAVGAGKVGGVLTVGVIMKDPRRTAHDIDALHLPRRQWRSRAIAHMVAWKKRMPNFMGEKRPITQPMQA